MKALLKQPLLWFVIASVVLVLQFQPWDKVKLKRGLRTPVDEYAELSYQSFAEIQHSARTFAFPYVLRALRTLTPSYASLPYYHVALQIVAAFVFYVGLRAYGFGGGLASACASTLLFTNTLIDYGWILTADATAVSLATLTVGVLLVVVSRPRWPLAWAALACALFFTYQTRPDYLFLVGLLPALGLLLWGMIAPGPEWRRRGKSMIIGLVAVCALPFLVFCAVRTYWVGHFGLVAYGGVSATNVSGWLLTDDLVPQLPEEVRPLALAALRGRAATMPDVRPTINEAGQLEPAAFEIVQADEGDGPYTVLLGNVYYPAAMSLYGNDPLEVNRRMGDLAAAVIKARPQIYGQWVARAMRVSLRQTIAHNKVLRLLIWPLAVLFGIWNLLFVTRRWAKRGGAEREPIPMKDYSFEFHAIVLIAASFAITKNVLASLVSAPTLRYIDAAGIFWPPVAIIVALMLWERVRFEWQSRHAWLGDRIVGK